MKCRNEYSVHLYIHMYICTVHFTSSALVSMFDGGYGWLIPFEIIFVSTFRALNFSRFIARLSLSYIVCFFCLKDSTWAPYEHTKKVSRTFSFSRRYLRKKCVRVVNNNMYICTTTLTHGKLFFFGKGKKLTKSNNKCNLIFSKIACPHSR